MMPVSRQRASAAKTQRRFATLARQECNYHRQQASRDMTQGNAVLARFHRAEAARCMVWVHKRARSAGQLARSR